MSFVPLRAQFGGGGMGGGGMGGGGMMPGQGQPMQQPQGPPGGPDDGPQVKSLERFFATPRNLKAVLAKAATTAALPDTAYGVLLLEYQVTPEGTPLGNRVLASFNDEVAAKLVVLADEVRFVVPKLPDGTQPTLSECRVALYYPMPDPNEPNPDVDTFVAYDVDGQPLNLPEVRKAIGYPVYLRQQGAKGRVTLKVLTDGNGFYRDHRVLASANQSLTDLVEEHAYKLRFQPAFKNKRPCKAWIVVHFDFG